MTSEDKTDKRQLILDVAEKLFAELGYDGASTRLIAKEASVNMAMLNYYFGGKEGLFIAVFERKVSSYRINLQNLNNDLSITPWEKIERWIDSFTCSVATTNNFQKIIYREITLSQRSEVSQHIIKMLGENAMELKKIINQGIQSKVFREVDTEMLISTLIGTKMYLVNASPIAAQIFKKDLSNKEVVENELRPRLKAHLLALLKSHLNPTDGQS